MWSKGVLVVQNSILEGIWPEVEWNMIWSVHHGMDNHGLNPEHDSLNRTLGHTILVMSTTTTVDMLLQLELTVINIVLGFEYPFVIM
eukprot:10178099-Ditylum_brightwellii.AAC.1